MIKEVFVESRFMFKILFIISLIFSSFDVMAKEALINSIHQKNAYLKLYQGTFGFEKDPATLDTSLTAKTSPSWKKRIVYFKEDTHILTLDINLVEEHRHNLYIHYQISKCPASDGTSRPPIMVVETSPRIKSILLVRDDVPWWKLWKKLSFGINFAKSDDQNKAPEYILDVDLSEGKCLK